MSIYDELARRTEELMQARNSLEPWRSLVGRISLNQSEYCLKGTTFAVDGRNILAHTPGFLSVVIHPEDRVALREMLVLNDEELAALLWYAATKDHPLCQEKPK